MRKHILQTDPKFVRRYRSFPIVWYPSYRFSTTVLPLELIHASANATCQFISKLTLVHRFHGQSPGDIRHLRSVFHVRKNSKMPRYAEWSLSKYLMRGYLNICYHTLFVFLQLKILLMLQACGCIIHNHSQNIHRFCLSTKDPIKIYSPKLICLLWTKFRNSLSGNCCQGLHESPGTSRGPDVQDGCTFLIAVQLVPIYKESLVRYPLSNRKPIHSTLKQQTQPG